MNDNTTWYAKSVPPPAMPLYWSHGECVWCFGSNSERNWPMKDLELRSDNNKPLLLSQTSWSPICFHKSMIRPQHHCNGQPSRIIRWCKQSKTMEHCFPPAHNNSADISSLPRPWFFGSRLKKRNVLMGFVRKEDASKLRRGRFDTCSNLELSQTVPKKTVQKCFCQRSLSCLSSRAMDTSSNFTLAVDARSLPANMLTILAVVWQSPQAFA